MEGGSRTENGIVGGRLALASLEIPESEDDSDRLVPAPGSTARDGLMEMHDGLGFSYFQEIEGKKRFWAVTTASGDAVKGPEIFPKDTTIYELEDGSASWIHPAVKREVVRNSNHHYGTEFSGRAGNLAASRDNGLLPHRLLRVENPGGSQDAHKITNGTTCTTEMKWTNLQKLHRRRTNCGYSTEGHTLTPVNKGLSIIKFGGNGLQGHSYDVNSFDCRSLNWQLEQPTGTVPIGRTGHGAAAIGSDQSRLLIFGGVSKDGRLNDLNMLDCSSMKWTPIVVASASSVPTQRGRMGMTAMANGTSAAVFGGRQGYRYLGDKYFNDIHIFDGQNIEWINVKPRNNIAPVPRSGASLHLVNDRQLFVFGGYEDGSCHFDDSWLFDLTSLTWNRIPYPDEPHPEAREGHASVKIADAVLVYGGESRKRGYVKDLHSFSCSSLRWCGEPVAEGYTPGNCTGMAAAKIDERRALFAGGDTGFRHSNESFILEVAHLNRHDVDMLVETAVGKGVGDECCVVCLEEPPAAIFLMCGHYVCCKKCAKLCDCCPMCRQHVSKVHLMDE